MRRVLGGALALSAAVALSAPVPAEAAVPGVQFKHYVALGDSFTAGPLIPNFAALDCARSTNNYPSTLAVKLGVYYEDDAFTDVSCSSADTTSMEGPQTTFLYTERAPQLDALRPDTDLVTIGIGGNDESFFGSIIFECPDFYDADPTGNPCQQHYTENGVDSLAAMVPRTKERIADVIAAAKDRSPNARIVLVGYPRLMPSDHTPCADLRMAEGDIGWVDSLQQQFNSVMRQVAAEGSVGFVDVYGPSLGHDPCAGTDAWVQGDYLNLFESVAWHPLRAGMDAVANLVYQHLNGTDLARGRQATASTTQSGYAPSSAVDNDPYTRWASYNWSDGEWFKVDLGARKTIGRLELNWEYAYAKGYRIEVSDDNKSWRTVWSTINADGGHDTISFGRTSARYVRMFGVTRGTRYGFSLHDLEVYGR